MAVDQWRLGRRPELDGLRGVAILLVVFCHASSLSIGRDVFRSMGSAGVTVFFTLSGFLITSLFVQEPHLGRFYRNRAVRLLPALAFAIAGFWLLQTLIGFRLLYGVGWVIGYLANWRLIAGGNLGVFDIAWSLSVEEQFYLLWPVLLLATRRWPRFQLAATAALLLLSTGARFLLYPIAGMDRAYLGSDTAGASLLVGCLLSLAARQGLRRFEIPTWMLATGSALVLALACDRASWNFAVLTPTVASWWTAVVIWARPPLTWRPLRYTGQRSYAIYLWHTGILWVAVQVVGRSPIWTAFTVLLVFGIAEVSWRLVERPAQAFRAGARTGALPRKSGEGRTAQTPAAVTIASVRKPASSPSSTPR